MEYTITPKERHDEVRAEIASTLSEMVAIRQDLHAHPELGFDEHRTSQFVAQKLESWGYEVFRHIGKTGVVGRLKKGTSTRKIGFRADMDALPIFEQTNLPYSSVNEGVMHACGHDGHTTILLTAARFLAEHGDFDGTLHVFFQPAEEGEGGAQAMIDDGLFEKFPCDKIFGLHNWPGHQAATMRFTKGAMMASADSAHITVHGRGGHGAKPESTIDPIVAASSIVMALQTIVSRNVNPLDGAIITVGRFEGGSAPNIIPERVELDLTIRAFSPEVREQLKTRLKALVSAQAESYGAKADITFAQGFPVTVNEVEATEFAQKVAGATFGLENVVSDAPPLTPSEDFSVMLEAVPGCYVIMGNGDSTDLHTPQYNFNDDTIADGALLWVNITEAYLSKNQ